MTRFLRPHLLLALLALLICGWLGRPPVVQADTCAFPFAPTSYEDLKNRKLFLETIDLAANNMLFPGDPYFGIPDLKVGPRNARKTQPGKVPPVLLKAIGWIESSITQSAEAVPFGAIGPALISFDCGHGVTQVTTGMTLPGGEGGAGSPQQALVATHFAYNIARGAVILANKWNEAPDMKPIAGIDTGALPELMENWYFAVWAYNGFTGPGANRSNHPMDPIYGTWPRPAYSCGPTGDGKGHNRGNYPYQELVYGCAASPPLIDNTPLWQGQTITLPDLNDAKMRDALKLENFVYPYAKMDIPTPQPFHLDSTPKPDASLKSTVLGSPAMNVATKSVKIGVQKGGGSTSEIVDVTNTGSGVLAWYATVSAPWLKVTPYAGVAVGKELPCEKDAPCDRTGHLEISVDASRAPPGKTSGKVQIQALGSSASFTVDVDVVQITRLGVPGVAKR
jgi:hypothetical protein